MAVNRRDFFFDPAFLDRFNSRDIPTEDVMREFLDSVPFIKETIDRAQLDRAGIAKTTTNAKVNTHDDTDQAGTSPAGFTTFVKPSQIPKLYSDDGSITVNRVTRGGSGDDADILDYNIEVTIPDPDIPEDSTDLTLGFPTDIKVISGDVGDCPLSVSNTNFTGTEGLNDFLTVLKNAIGKAVEQVVDLTNKVCPNVGAEIAVGDVILTTVAPVAWTDSFLEPTGQLLAYDDYPALGALFGSTYGGSGVPGGNFALPNLVANSGYLKALPSGGSPIPPGSLTGGSNSYSLSEPNIPEHTHSVTGNTTSNGEHSHPLNSPTNNTGSVNNTVRVGSNVNNATSFTDASTGGHSHTISGTTDAFGGNPVTPIPITPIFQHFYLKMRVK